MQDLNELQRMGMLCAEAVEAMQQTIDENSGREMEAAMHRIEALQSIESEEKAILDQHRHIEGHRKPALPKNKRKRLRKMQKKARQAQRA